MHFYFNGRPFEKVDSFVRGFYVQPDINNYHFEWNGEMPFVMMRDKEVEAAEHEKEWSDKVKQTRKWEQQNGALLRKRMGVTGLNKMKLVDSLLEKKLRLHAIPEDWAVVMEPIREELKKEHPQLTIIIENNLITVNGRSIQIDTASGMNPSLKKQVKVIELMRQ